MLKFIFRKILSKKWMFISLLTGNLLMIAIAAAVPMYSDAVLQRTMIQDLGKYQAEKNRYPGTILVQSGNNAVKKNTGERAEMVRQSLDALEAQIGVPALVNVEKLYKNNFSATPLQQLDNKGNKYTMEFASYSDLADHINIIYGEMFSAELQGNVIEVIVNKRDYSEQNLMLGDEMELTSLKNADGELYRIKIVGVFENKEAQDPYWLTAPASWSKVCLMDQELMKQVFAMEGGRLNCDIQWLKVLDYTQMQAENVDEMLELTTQYERFFKDQNIHMGTYYKDTLEAFRPKEQKLNITIMVLQMPIFLLLFAYIFMVSGQMLEMEQNEISVYKSRGASKGQIIGMYSLQSILIAAGGMAGGIPLGMVVCKALGASNAFLEFVRRTALPVSLGWKVWVFAAVAALFSIATMVIPVFKYANVNIVAHKRQKNRKSTSPWWQKIFLDVVLLVVSVYGWYQFKSEEEYLAAQVADGASLDPMLYIYSSLFMLGFGLLVLRLLPLLIRLIFRVGKKSWSPALYASFLRIIRTKDNQGFLIVFLILTVALGIYNTQTARTINLSAEERIYYVNGADLVLQERWQTSAPVEGVSALNNISYIEPDFNRYAEMDGVESVTKVFVDKAGKVTADGTTLKNVHIMGIHTKEFGETAWFKESLLNVHWYEYLNAMSQNARAILVSANFRDKYGYEVGDALTYTNAKGNSIKGIIYGFVDYWPSFTPATRTIGDDGSTQVVDNFLVVANLSQVQSSWGVLPYQIWIKTEGSSAFLYDYAKESGTQYTMFQDAAAELIAQKNDPIFQGTNGILTIGFIIVLVLCTTGFLIYWILSIQSRTLQFGIFRAMGMTGREVLSMLVNEQFFVSGASIASGVLVGKIGAELFVPLVQIAYSAAEQVIPLEVISQMSDYMRLGVVIGVMLVLCMVILCVLISRIKISQALKLGED